MSNPNMHLDMVDLSDRYMEANARGDKKTMREIAGQIKISPGMAVVALQHKGKEKFLALGYDLSRVEKELGEDWLERYGE